MDIWKAMPHYKDMTCKRCGGTNMTQLPPDMLYTCMNCGYVSDEVVMEYQVQFQNNKPQVHIEEMKKDMNVLQFVVHLHSVVYPLGNNNKHWVKTVKNTYSKLRNTKGSMRGLRMPIIIGTIVYCMLIVDNTPMTIPLLVSYLNETLNRFYVKEKQITIEKFEEYRDGKKKEFKKVLQKIQPKCFGCERPRVNKYLPFGINLLKLGNYRTDIMSITRIVEKHQDRLFKITNSNSEIATCILFIGVLMSFKSPPKKSEFILGIKTSRILTLYDNIISSEIEDLKCMVCKYKLRKTPFRTAVKKKYASLP